MTCPRLVLLIAGSAMLTATAADQGLAAAYYDDIAFGGTRVDRIDAAIDFSWNGAPPVDGIPGTKFSVQWRGTLTAPADGAYTLITDSDDGIRVWLDGTLLIDDWSDHPPTRDSAAPVALSTGSAHVLSVDFYQGGGGSLARLSWLRPDGVEEVVPTSALSPAQRQVPLEVVPGAASRVSPAWIAGRATRDATVTATISGVPRPCVRHGEAWYADDGGSSAAGVALDPARAVDYAIDDGVATVSGSVAWIVTDLNDLYGIDHLTIRPGDALLVIDGAAVGDAAFDADYDPAQGFRPSVATAGGAPAIVRFTLPGTHVLESGSGGTPLHGLTIQVATVDWHGPTACQIGFCRDKLMTAGTADVVVGSSDPERLSVAATAGGDGIALRITPVDGSPASLWASIGDEWGPLVAAQRVDAFSVYTSARRGTFVSQQYADGSSLSDATMFLDPLVPGLRVDLRVFVSGVTFADGSTDLQLWTDAFDRDLASGTRGFRSYGLIRAAGIPWAVCHSFVVYQDDYQVSR